MIDGYAVSARVRSFHPAGFVDTFTDHDDVFPVAGLDVIAPAERAGTRMALVLDTPLERSDLLRPGAVVRLYLDPAALGFDPMFAGAVVDGAVHPAEEDTP